jgi:hypothetical protein
MRKVTLNGRPAIESPYRYSVRPKSLVERGEASPRTNVRLDGRDVTSRLTSGRGKGAVERYYAYYYPSGLEGSQEWIEITGDEFLAARRDPAYRLEIVSAPAPAPAAEPAPAAAPAKGKKAERATA